MPWIKPFVKALTKVERERESRKHGASRQQSELQAETEERRGLTNKAGEQQQRETGRQAREGQTDAKGWPRPP
jgi:hypothetical protein